MATEKTEPDFPVRELSEDDKKKILRRFLLGVKNGEKRTKIVRLANILSENDDESDEFFAALRFYSNPENDRIMRVHFAEFAVGGTAGFEETEATTRPSRPPAKKGKRKRRGKGS
jgi:hypothetical protein